MIYLSLILIALLVLLLVMFLPGQHRDWKSPQSYGDMPKPQERPEESAAELDVNVDTQDLARQLGQPEDGRPPAWILEYLSRQSEAMHPDIDELIKQGGTHSGFTFVSTTLQTPEGTTHSRKLVNEKGEAITLDDVPPELRETLARFMDSAHDPKPFIRQDVIDLKPGEYREEDDRGPKSS